MEQIEIREGAKRAVVLSKSMLLHYLGLERLRSTRIEWIFKDVAAYFPHVYMRTVKETDLFVFSKFPEEEFEENMVQERIIRFNPRVLELSNFVLGGEQAVNFINKHLPYLEEISNLYEFSITTSLSLLIQGTITPSSVFGKKGLESD